MAFGGFNQEGRPAPMSEINMVPLIDVMLVLLIVFMITAPLLTHAVKIDLPRAASTVNLTKPEHIEFGLRENGEMFWNDEAVSLDELSARSAAAARQEPPPELHIRADRLVPYEKVAQVMAIAARNGLARIGFVSDPAAP